MRRALPVAALALLAATLGACNSNDLLTVRDPDVPGPKSLTGPGALPVLLNGTIGDFAFAYLGADPNDGGGLIAGTGLLADELRSSTNLVVHNQIDQRNTPLISTSNLFLFRNIQIARASADRVAAAYAQFAPDSSGHALALALSGFATLLMGESYCSGIPFSTIDATGTVITYGDPLPTPAVWARALAKFDSAAGLPIADSAVRNLIAIGRGRVLLDAGQFDAAAAAVSGVPAGYHYLIGASANTLRETNGVEFRINENGQATVSDSEGVNGLPYRSANDPRVLWANAMTTGFDGVTPLFVQLMYPTRSSSVPLATAAEARLIEAESALQHGDGATFLVKLNAARAEFSGLTPLASVPASRDSQVTLLFQERAFSLFLTAHRLGDMRRLIRQYGRSAATVFPIGTWYRGPASSPVDQSPYGTDVNLPIPQEEQNNPRFHGCIDRNA